MILYSYGVVSDGRCFGSPSPSEVQYAVAKSRKTIPDGKFRPWGAVVIGGAVAAALILRKKRRKAVDVEN